MWVFRCANESPNRKVVDDFFHFLFVVLETVEPATEIIVFEVQQPETRSQLRDEGEDLFWTLVIAGRHAVHTVPRLQNQQLSLLQITPYEGRFLEISLGPTKI